VGGGEGGGIRGKKNRKEKNGRGRGGKVGFGGGIGGV